MKEFNVTTSIGTHRPLKDGQDPTAWAIEAVDELGNVYRKKNSGYIGVYSGHSYVGYPKAFMSTDLVGDRVKAFNDLPEVRGIVKLSKAELKAAKRKARVNDLKAQGYSIDDAWEQALSEGL